ncbi:hypothetical protein [Thermogemmatispora aurantia]|jgi:dihydroxy-acid dehydratase|nr:hypothetical protein [Thermogemmatispora aurantia]
MWHRSRVLIDGRERAAARAMLKAIGFRDEDLQQQEGADQAGA